ncbi:Amidohydrolase 2 [Penicillium argentinense]|uniref:6-methylsalicylate decarboxylase n=1 Tax=Penicillium argentinense TaxID=1131581 RepID=A0A9W9EQK0_9EURO|nr:Amidohydrolase 2 [Penicillium argentinense]KAJ5085974.1 Amidohydrolase 2 [Penicillium argentinense]
MERIDVHAHCVPPAYREYCLQNDFAGRGHPDGMPAIPDWSPEAHIQMMRDLNINKSILSMSSPGTHLTPGNNAEARKLTRQVNEDMSRICSENKDHFLFFASLPLPDVEGSLAEIDYALDHLGAIGFQILTNSHGIYPGDKLFSPIFDRLNERGTIIFFHPTSCNIQTGNGSSVETITPMRGVPSPVMEFMFDSTRALTSLFTSGTVARCTKLTYLVCHCGATFPPIVARIAEFSAFLLGKQITEEEIKQLLQRHFYIDLAGVPFPDQIHGILRLVDSSRLLYGSDYPYTPAPLAGSLAKRLDDGLAGIFDKNTSQQIVFQNAKSLISLRTAGQWFVAGFSEPQKRA